MLSEDQNRTGQVHKITNLSRELASVGERQATVPLPHGRSGSALADPRPQSQGLCTRDIYIPDLHLDAIKVRTREFR